MKAKLGNPVSFATLTQCLPPLFDPATSRKWSVVLACVSRQRETKCKIYLTQVSAYVLRYVLARFSFHR
jgi:hypothetical protein